MFWLESFILLALKASYAAASADLVLPFEGTLLLPAKNNQEKIKMCFAHDSGFWIWLNTISSSYD